MEATALMYLPALRLHLPVTIPPPRIPLAGLLVSGPLPGEVTH